MWDDPKTGFFARAYINTKTGEVTIAYANTQTVEDAIADVQQAFSGSSAQHSQAIALAQEVVKSGGFNGKRGSFSVTGHSLGGGLAMTAALSFQQKNMRSANTFNAAGLTVTIGNIGSHLYGSLAGKNTGLFNHVIGYGFVKSGRTFGDPVSLVNSLTPGMYVPGRDVFYSATSMSPLANHSMNAFRGKIDGY